MLQEYRRKRNFKITKEPTGRTAKKLSRNHFVIQKHAAKRLHYDFRLEVGDVLKSWACPKGLPYQRGEKHLAVMVEDHPIAYGDFEGTIPQGQYGGGTVMVWDRGTYEVLTPLKDLKKGKLHFILHGKKLKGEWYLVRFKNEENQWLMIKGGDSIKPISKKMDDLSVLSKKTMNQLSRSNHVWQSWETKKHGRIHQAISVHQKNSPPASRKKFLKAAPLPTFVTPMKAKFFATPPTTGKWSYEIKFDGWRALALKGGDRVHLLSRNKKDLSKKFPEIISSLLQVHARDAILDGEIVALNKKGVSSFQLLQAYDIGTQRPPIYFYVFDLLQLNGKDFKKKPLQERQTLLKSLNLPGNIRLSAGLGDNAKLLLKQVKKLGCEGLIGKNIQSPYESGKRSGYWIKLKLVREQEFVIGGYTDPKGSRPFFGSLVVGYYKRKKLMCAGNVGTGFNKALLSSIHHRLKSITRNTCPFENLSNICDTLSITKKELKSYHWVKPVMVCQLKFTEWTRDKRLRQPVFLGLREDKNAANVVIES